MIPIQDTLSPIGKFFVAKTENIGHNNVRLDVVINSVQEEITALRNSTYTKADIDNEFAEVNSEFIKINSTLTQINVELSKKVDAQSGYSMISDAEKAQIQATKTATETLREDLTATQSEVASKASSESVSDLQTEMAVQTARMDQLVGTVPPGSADEIADARVMTDGKTAANLGDAIRSQTTRLKEQLDSLETDMDGLLGKSKTEYNDDTPSGRAISTTARWFLNGYATGRITAVNVRFRLASSATLEIWEKDGNTLNRIKTVEISSEDPYAWKKFDVDCKSDKQMYVSIVANADNSIYQMTDATKPYNALYTSNKTAETLDFDALSEFAGLNVTGYIEYNSVDLANIAPRLSAVESTTAILSTKYDDLNEEVKELAEAVKGKEVNTTYNTNPVTGNTINNTNRWFLNGFGKGKIETVTLRCKLENKNIKIEVWEKVGDNIRVVKTIDTKSYKGYDFNTFDIGYISENPVYISVTPETDTVYQITDTSLSFNALRTNDLVTESMPFSNLVTFNGLNVIGYITYVGSKQDKVKLPVITVSKDGNGDYTTIADAVSAASDGDIVYVYQGTYTEPVEAWGKTISIIGADKYNCIIKNSTANYATPAVEIDSGRIANFTIISDGASPTCSASDTANYMKDYSIHVDDAHATGKTLIIEDCIIKNNHRTALGMGCYADNTVIVRNCDIWSDVPPSNIQNPLWNKRGAIYFHNRQNSAYFTNITGQKMRFIGNTVYCEDIIAVYIGDTWQSDFDSKGYVNEMEVEFINNMICAKNPDGSYKTASDGIATPTAFTENSIISGTGFSDHIKLSTISYGNNVSYLNAQ